jgi:hypothetical protein
MVKVTFTLDDGTVERLRSLSARLKKPQSQVVREAVREYGDRAAKLSDEEKARLLKVFDTLVPAIPKRPQREVDAELADIRAARRRWGKRPASGR